VVGLNDNPPYHVTYGVNATVAKVRDFVSSDTFLRRWSLKVIPHEPELVLRCRVFWMPRTDNLIIIASEDDRTLIHGTAYIEDLYDVCKSEYATLRLGRIINDLVGDLNVVKGEPFIDEHLKAVATGFVSQHTRTKFSMIQDRFRGWLAALGRIERPYRTALGWILAVWVLIDALIGLLHLYGWEFDATLALIETTIFFPLAVIVDLLLPARISGKSGTV